MKRFLLTLSILVCTSHSLYCEETNNNKQQQQAAIDEEGMEILGHFAGMLGSFVGILQAPHDPANVGNNIGNMVHGLANILQVATRSGKDLAAYIESEEFILEVEAMMKTKNILPTTEYETTT